MKNEGIEWNGHYIAYVTSMNDIESDLFRINLLSQAVQSQGGKFTVIMPYLPAARSDKGAPIGAITYASMLAVSEIDKLICVDPHSEVMPDLLKKAGIFVDSVRLDELQPIIPFKEQYDVVIAPDAGASTRASLIARKLGIPCMSAEKTRDQATGRITKYIPPILNKSEHSILVIDDMCDGGATFEMLAKSIPDENSGILDLFVTHGIFSKGTHELLKNYDVIYTTNSYDVTGTHHGVESIDIQNLLLERA